MAVRDQTVLVRGAQERNLDLYIGKTEVLNTCVRVHSRTHTHHMIIHIIV